MTDAGKISALTRAEKQRLAEELLRQRAAREQEHAHEHEHTLPLSFGQQSLWVVHQMDPANTAFNITTRAAVHGPLDIDALHRAFQGVVHRHPLLRTTYHDAEGTPVQRVHAQQTVDLTLIDTASWDQDRLNTWQAEEAERPFDLGRGPLLRLTVLTRSGSEHLLFFVAHHIAVDFASLQIIFNDLRMLYESEDGNPGSMPQPLPAHYREYIERQREMLASAEGEELWVYWREKLSGDLPILELPTDFPRPPAQSLAGATLHFDLGEELTTRLRALARREGVTLYNTVLAAFFTLLHRYTGQDDLIIGSPMVGRSEPEFQQVVGYFVNPVPIRASLAGDPTFRDLLRQVRRASVEALAHHRLPFPVLVQRLQPVRDPSRPPIFQVAMNWNQTRALEQSSASPNGDRLSANGHHDGRLVYEVLRGEQRGAPLDLSLMLSEGSRSISGYLQYATRLFRADTIERMAGHLRVLLDAVASDSDVQLSQLPLLTESERHQILAEWNDTYVAYSTGETLPRLFEAQTTRTPEATALI
ncbi:MAG: non-ribosomal peptide synthetase, partial [Hyphomicrobiales bacterium]|nr:non-ribosomal peptide synthetase [Hyphomicrobiales bacterium]